MWALQSSLGKTNRRRTRLRSSAQFDFPVMPIHSKLALLLISSHTQSNPPSMNYNQNFE